MATSINSPSLEHAIHTDIPAINVIVNALAKGDPSVLSDLETGTKRIVEGPSGWEFQQLGKNGWVTLSSFNIDAQKVDGFEASAKVAKNTIPVRDAEGKIPGDISGTAASAESLTSTLSIGGGGTGASSVEQARSNLGVPPINHSLNSPDYGVGTSALYGHLKLSDSTNLTSGENGGIAATPKAVKAAYDRASEGLTASDAVQENLDNFTTAQAAKDAEQDEAIKANMGALPVGFEYVRLTGQAPYPGGVDYFGQEATRAMYADLWAYQNEHRPESIVTEAKWQELYASQNGNVPYYSTGDGNTTFRFPRVVSYLKVGGNVDEMGQYVQEGLPDHTHTRGTMNITGKFDPAIIPAHGDYCEGAFYGTYDRPDEGFHRIASAEAPGPWGFGFDASRSWTGSTSPASESNSTYSNSPHVTPETMTIVMGVIAISVPGVMGTASEAVIYEELALQSAEIESKVSKSGDRIEYLNLPIGILRSSANPAWLSLDLEGITPGMPGGLIALRSTASQNDPGSVAMLSRRADGSDGPFFTLLQDRILTNGKINFQPTGGIIPNQTSDLRELIVVADDEAGWGGLLALRSITDPRLPGGFVLQVNGPGGQHNLIGDSYGGLYWQDRVLAREHNLYVNLGGYIYGSGGVWFSGRDDQTIGVHTAKTNCDCDCNCDCSDGCGSY